VFPNSFYPNSKVMTDFWGAVEKWLHFFKTLNKDLQQNVSDLFPFGPPQCKKITNIYQH
jgi:hypothetical protein